MVQIRFGDQLIEIAQTQLIFRKQHNMLTPHCSRVIAPEPGAQGKHCFVNGLHILYAQFPELFHQLSHNRATGKGIVPRPVVVKVRQGEMLCHLI